MTETERDIIQTLTLRIPLLSAVQIGRTWCPGSDPERLLTPLCARGWLLCVPANAYPELPLDEPLGTWSPGDEAPRFGHLADQNRQRWNRENKRVKTYVATDQAVEVYGGHAGEAKPLHISHDIGLAGTYLHFRAQRPAEARRWVSELDLATKRDPADVLPDAALCSPEGELERVIEFVGTSYTAARLEELYLDCEVRSVPIEYW